MCKNSLSLSGRNPCVPSAHLLHCLLACSPLLPPHSACYSRLSWDQSTHKVCFTFMKVYSSLPYSMSFHFPVSHHLNLQFEHLDLQGRDWNGKTEAWPLDRLAPIGELKPRIDVFLALCFCSWCTLL